jgi:hypothetical protein
MNRSFVLLELIKDSQALSLMTLIALRASRQDGVAYLGDWRESGCSSEASYRRTKRRLESRGLAKFSTSRKGTKAWLLSTEVFDINEVSSEKTEDLADAQPTLNRRESDAKVTNRALTESLEESDTYDVPRRTGDAKVTTDRRPSDAQATTNKKKKNNTNKFKEDVCALGVSEELITEYLQTRTRVKAPNSEQALKTLLNKLQRFSADGFSAHELIEMANEKGWKSVGDKNGPWGQSQKPVTHGPRRTNGPTKVVNIGDGQQIDSSIDDVSLIRLCTQREINTHGKSREQLIQRLRA